MSKRRSGLFNNRKAYPCCKSSVVCNITSIENVNWTYFTPTGEYSSYSNGFLVTWNPIPNGTVYLITQVGISPETFELLTPTSANYYANVLTQTIDVYAHINGCPDVSGSVAPCFFKDALVTMADGFTKEIQDVIVGDMVVGAFGEHNQVLALHRPLLGNNTMTNINNEHHTSSHHPHISDDKRFYSCKPSITLSNTYGKYHEVLDENMMPYQRFLNGLNAERVEQMELGLQLKTINGSKEVTILDTYEMAPETQLYNLVLSGSHTYYVDGYAVTGWPNEDDFDYDLWQII
jgi:hypothetical protein